MNNFSSLEKLTLFEIEVTQKISDSNIRNFLLSFFKIQNFIYKDTDKIFLSYIDELKIYQLLIFNEEEKYFDFQLFEEYYKEIEIENSIDLYICNNFFCLYKNGEFYYLQKIILEISNDELFEYINNKFGNKINKYKFISENEMVRLKDKYLNNPKKKELKLINLRKKYSFCFYILYIFILIKVMVLYFFFNFNIEEKNNDIDNNLQIEIFKKEHQFISFEEKISLLLEKIDSNNLDLISLEFNQNRLKIVLNSDIKENIYSFLEENKAIFLSSSINFLENKSLYEVVINVKLF
ncbi:hypothetical protein [Arcobacter aquimarinus]|uniref:Uncharacterized protein n=1 Tax=Arcobacter aquimarinus TaxID=1315211 RepID=A0AAE7E2F8_9BACT|nr:hypothetical protein [Arcobacter aquimarinus]QKE26591.1 hypothetical protein AAQM_1853 [Arcobacter aquimarinus]